MEQNYINNKEVIVYGKNLVNQPEFNQSEIENASTMQDGDLANPYMINEQLNRLTALAQGLQKFGTPFWTNTISYKKGATISWYHNDVDLTEGVDILQYTGATDSTVGESAPSRSSWITLIAQVDTSNKVSKAGDEMTGTLKLKVLSADSGIALESYSYLDSTKLTTTLTTSSTDCSTTLFSGATEGGFHVTNKIEPLGVGLYWGFSLKNGIFYKGDYQAGKYNFQFDATTGKTYSGGKELAFSEIRTGTLTFKNSWGTQYVSSYETLRLRRCGSVVSLTGSMYCSSPPPQNAIAVEIPVGFREVRGHNFDIVSTGLDPLDPLDTFIARFQLSTPDSPDGVAELYYKSCITGAIKQNIRVPITATWITDDPMPTT